MLREDFMADYGLTVSSLASALGVSRQSVNELLRERRAITPEMALRLARLFGNTPEFWLNAQLAVDPGQKKNNARDRPEKVGACRPIVDERFVRPVVRVGGGQAGARVPLTVTETVVLGARAGSPCHEKRAVPQRGTSLTI